VANKYVLSRHTEVNAHIVELAVAMVPVGCFDGYATAHDPIGKSFKFGSFLANTRFDRRRRLHTEETYLQGDLHRAPTKGNPSRTGFAPFDAA
jgi:hypothetical protein